MEFIRHWCVLILSVFACSWVLSCGKSGVQPGISADIDPAPFYDAAKDAQPVADVVKPIAGSAAAVAGKKPNVVVILADDLGYGDLASYGTKSIRTPNLDRLANEGVRFTDFYASASVCSPSRAGLLTGRYPVRTGVSYVIFASEASLSHRISLAMSRIGTSMGTSDYHDSYVHGIPDSEITLPEALKVAGYATGMVGKWHLGDFSHDAAFAPTRHGFDFFEGIPHSNDEFPVAYWRGEEELTPNIGLDQEHVTADFTKAAVGFIEANEDKPFFLYVAHKDVHLPFFPSKDFKGKSSGGPFGDAAEELDWSVGEIMKTLDARGLRENTLVIFTSDNGVWIDGSTDGLRGGKGMPFEGGQRVPFIASWPGTLGAGKQVSTPAMNIDVFPTILSLAGVGLPSDRVIDGRDLWGVMSGRQSDSPHESLLFFHDKVIEGVRSGTWKYYRYVNRYRWPIPMDSPSTFPGRRAERYTYTDPKTGKTIRIISGFPLLYDLGIDPNEAYNVADRHPDETKRLLAYMEQWEQDFFRNPRGWK